ncbi:WecB/TagA/CpsF family glycosyltransferase [Blastococcus xanthinilyticus]|uniref:WecB/TagA/CpsF family glycosyltransferase n=1 Tax=Blastococcus xanthinilyticus TaxID=1564164 RepID=UPI00141367E1|nr:WecB/TagA/CpsF family glycosyltransferase [Blastococcus xanthinilyticus]
MVPVPVEPAERFAQMLADNLAAGVGGTLTWLNHYTALQTMQAEVPLDCFDYVGLDGILLCRLVQAECERTSADLVMPALLARTSGLRIALIGSTEETLRTVAAAIEEQSDHRVVLIRDGYEGLPEPAVLRRQLRAARAQLVIVGLGAPRQDFYVLSLAMSGMLISTCGGWLDQYAGDGDYYPAWAYPLRLNWLVRLVREPRRLWRRYSIDVVRALRMRRALTEFVTGLGGEPLRAAGGASARVAGRPAA